MNTHKKSLAVVACLVLSIGTAGCPKEQQQGQGFTVTAVAKVYIGGIVPFTQPLQGIDISGFELEDLPNATGFRTTFNRLTDADGTFFVDGGRFPARWRSVVLDPHDPPVCSPNIADFNVTFEQPSIDWLCPEYILGANPQFSMTSVVPSNLTVSSPGSGFSSANGAPYLDVYGSEGQFVSRVAATSVAADSKSATFPFPSDSNGSTLLPGLYGFNAWNPDPSAGAPQIVGGGFLSLGSTDSSRPTPFGVDVYKVEDSWESCEEIPDMGWYCYSGSSQNTEPIVTLSSTGQVADGTGTIWVGAQPIAVRAFRVDRITEEYWSPSYDSYEIYATTRATRAIVANFGSNSVSVVDLANRTTLANIPVGTDPTALVITADESKAYVTNSGSGTISELNLIGMSQTRASWVGSRPTAVAMDPGGTSLWVGGEGFVAKVDLNSLAVVSSFSVNGLVTSLAVSPGQGTLLYTTVSNTTTTGSGQAAVTPGSSFSVKETRLSDFALLGSYASSFTESYQAASDGASTPGILLASGCLVSANYGNSLAVAATPTGFVVIDLYNHTEVMSGSTPSPVRGIATDPGQGVVYLTAPQSNALISVPLPPVQQ